MIHATAAQYLITTIYGPQPRHPACHDDLAAAEADRLTRHPGLWARMARRFSRPGSERP